MPDRFNALCGQEESDHKFLVELIAQICDYAVDNDMKPNDTIMIIANNMLMLTEISNFDNWKRRSEEELMRAIRYDRDQFSQGWLAGYNKALRDAWIDPAVQTPDDEQTVFFYDNDGEYHVGWYRAEDQDFDCDSYYVDLIDVLGWQPCVKSGEDANA